MKMTARKIRFCQEYVVDFNGTQAAIRAGYAKEHADSQACRLLADPDIKAKVDELKDQLATKAELTPLWVLEQWKKTALADPNELTQLRRTCCRHCHGYDHAYQLTDAEYVKAVNIAIDTGKDAPSADGGIDFDVNAAPHPNCPECGGDGIESVYHADTRKLKGNARHLYLGVKKTKNGIEIMQRNKDEALANIAKFLGMNVERKEISGPNGQPLAIANLSADDLTDDQLAALIATGVSDAESK
jgi:phage terminase small subunit